MVPFLASPIHIPERDRDDKVCRMRFVLTAPANITTKFCVCFLISFKRSIRTRRFASIRPQL